MAVVNANYEFTMVDIGDSGRQSDGGVFAASKLGFAMDNDQVGLPKPRILPGTNTLFPYVFVGDEAFPLKTYLIKPYARHAAGIEEQITHYGISRARRQVENVFGICASRVRIFRRPIIGDVETVISVTKAVFALHNFLTHGRQYGEGNNYCPQGYAEGEWRNDENHTEGILPIGNVAFHNYSRDSRQVRDNFKNYFNSAAGAVQWQNERVQRTDNPFDRPYRLICLCTVYLTDKFSVLIIAIMLSILNNYFIFTIGIYILLKIIMLKITHHLQSRTLAKCAVCRFLPSGFSLLVGPSLLVQYYLRNSGLHHSHFSAAKLCIKSYLGDPFQLWIAESVFYWPFFFLIGCSLTPNSEMD